MVNAEKKHNIENTGAGKPCHDDINTFRSLILEWYDRHRRVLPWRAHTGVTPEPYHVWLSEIMLQQTVVAAVVPYFLKFIETWPDIRDLAAADNDDVMTAWAGLGYYARARNLHKCAKTVSYELQGVFPQDQKKLQALPGIGDYTSAAIRAIAFAKPAVVVDGNIERVMARFHAVTTPLPDSKKELKALAADYAEDRADRPGDYSQALMDLGATICTPKAPKCGLCPLAYACAAKAQGIAGTLPRKLPKKPKPEKHGYVYWIENEQGAVLIEKRPERGLLGGMTGFPTSDWVEREERKKHLHNFQNMQIHNKGVSVYHSFTHFNLTLECVHLCVEQAQLERMIDVPSTHRWLNVCQLKEGTFPTLFAKCLILFRETV